MIAVDHLSMVLLTSVYNVGMASCCVRERKGRGGEGERGERGKKGRGGEGEGGERGKRGEGERGGERETLETNGACQEQV